MINYLLCVPFVVLFLIISYIIYPHEELSLKDFFVWCCLIGGVMVFVLTIVFSIKWAGIGLSNILGGK